MEKYLMILKTTDDWGIEEFYYVHSTLEGAKKHFDEECENCINNSIEELGDEDEIEEYIESVDEAPDYYGENLMSMADPNGSWEIKVISVSELD